jgi:hypothetical protein
MTVNMLRLDALRAMPLERDPFEFGIVRQFVAPEACRAIATDYPEIKWHGSFPLERLAYGPAFGRLIEELRSPEFRIVCEEKFAVRLAGRPTVLTVRGHCSAKDGQIHTDSASKILTILVYMNRTWEPSSGRLRLLRSADNLDDYAAEVSPEEGTLLVFRRSENSWHGHKSYEGPRRVIQLNWVSDASSASRHVWRHRISATMKGVAQTFRRAPVYESGVTARAA